MPEYTDFLGLYEPSRMDRIALDTSLTENFQKIDAKLGSALRDSQGQDFATLQDRLNYMEQHIVTNGTVINLLEYGASGKRNDDSTLFINSAIQELSSRGGGTLEVPSGSYKLTSEIIVKSNVMIKSQPTARFYKDHNGYMIINNELGSSSTLYNGGSNIIIEGGTWDALGAVSKVMHNTFAFGHGKSIIFRNMIVMDTAGSHAIEISACKDVIFDNCKFHGFYDTGGRNFSEAIQIDLMKDADHFGAFGAYDHTSCLNIIVRNCYFGASGTAGTMAWGRGVGSHASTIGVWHKNIFIMNNVFDNLGCQAIRAYNWGNLVIHGNSILNCGGAIQINPADTSDPKDTKDKSGVITNKSQPCYNFTISDNTIEGGGNYTTVLGVKGEATGVLHNISITGNKIRAISTTSEGVIVKVSFGNNVVIANNTIDGGQFASIDIGDSNNVNITTNVINNSGDVGIKVKGNVNGTVIQGNQVRNSQNLGIYLAENINSTTVTGNIVAGSKGAYQVAITTGVDYLTMSNNIVRQGSGVATGVQLTSTCSYVIFTNNITTGLTNAITLTTTIVNSSNL